MYRIYQVEYGDTIETIALKSGTNPNNFFAILHNHSLILIEQELIHKIHYFVSSPLDVHFYIHPAFVPLTDVYKSVL